MADDRLTHLREVGRLLWPAPLELAIGPASGAAPAPASTASSCSCPPRGGPG
jgi:hypothetical protein